MKSRGLGDTIHKFTTKTGIAKIVDKATGGGCGCGKRRETLNSMFPYKSQSTGKTVKNRVIRQNKKG